MKQVKIKFIGRDSIMLHNNRAADPLSEVAKIMKPFTSKRNKTDADHETIGRMEWEAGLYIADGQVVIPARCIEATILKASRKSKNGPKVTAGVLMDENYAVLSYKGEKIQLKDSTTFPNPELDKFYPMYKDRRMVKVGTAQVARTRPVFDGWSLSFTLNLDTDVIDDRTVLSICEDAGNMVGLCEMRPRYGRFDVEKLK